MNRPMKTKASSGLLFLLLLAVLPSVRAHVELDYPKGGESFQAGDTVHIQWHELIPHNTLNWDLLVSFDGGLSWDTLQADIPYDSLSFVWEVPERNADSTRIRIVQDNSGFDYFDESGDFQITALNALQDRSLEMGFRFGPNPTSGKLFVRFSPLKPHTSHLSLWDAGGRVCGRFEALSPKMEIDLSGLPSGVFFLRLETEAGAIVCRVVRR